MSDVEYMDRAIRLAAQGGKAVRPNPLVGAVIVKDGEVVGEGYHTRYGAPHAEREALAVAGERARGATMYVTLEPCSHHGKTPPCTDALIESGIAEVYIGMHDPNPNVQGNGIKLLEAAGIKCHAGLLEDQCKAQNEVFLVNVLQNRPFVHLKIAQTLDGFIAPEDGNSKWITGEEARTIAHGLRAASDAIMVGQGTLVQDDPALTIRHVEGIQPLRILLTDTLALPMTSQLFTDEFREKTHILYIDPGHINAEAVRVYENAGIQVHQVRMASDGKADLAHVLDIASELGVYKLMIEGGAGMYSSFLEADIVDRIDAFVAPTLFGKGIHGFGGLQARTVATAAQFRLDEVRQAGKDIYAILRRG